MIRVSKDFAWNMKRSITHSNFHTSKRSDCWANVDSYRKTYWPEQPRSNRPWSSAMMTLKRSAIWKQNWQKLTDLLNSAVNTSSFPDKKQTKERNKWRSCRAFLSKMTQQQKAKSLQFMSLKLETNNTQKRRRFFRWAWKPTRTSLATLGPRFKRWSRRKLNCSKTWNSFCREKPEKKTRSDKNKTIKRRKKSSFKTLRLNLMQPDWRKSMQSKNVRLWT